VPEIPVAAEAGVFRRLARGLFRTPARTGEGAVARDGARFTPAAPHVPQPHPHAVLPRTTQAELVDAVAQGRETHWLTRRALTEAGPEGALALQTMDRYGTRVVYAHGGGCFYQHADNTVHIDLDSGNAAAELVHESVHVRWAHEGRHADPAKMGRTEFVNSALSEETEATTRQIHANVHMQTTRPHLNSPNVGLQAEYAAGYRTGFQNADSLAWQQGGRLSPNERHMAGVAGGTSAVNGGFHGGLAATSNTGVPYPKYYGDAWDAYEQYVQKYGQVPGSV
jgi:hypothetical protein